MKNYKSKKDCKRHYIITIFSKNHGEQNVMIYHDEDQTNWGFNGCWRVCPIDSEGDVLWSRELNGGEFYNLKKEFLNELKNETRLEEIAAEVASIVAEQERVLERGRKLYSELTNQTQTPNTNDQ